MLEGPAAGASCLPGLPSAKAQQPQQAKDPRE